MFVKTLDATFVKGSAHVEGSARGLRWRTMFVWAFYTTFLEGFTHEPCSFNRFLIPLRDVPTNLQEASRTQRTSGAR